VHVCPAEKVIEYLNECSRLKLVTLESLARCGEAQAFG
jgi:hypothetical protein